MNLNLLTKTLRWYIVFAVIILLVTAPIFYFVTQHLYIDEANETLKLRKKEFVHYYLLNIKIEGIENWNRYNRDEKILPQKNKHKKDKLATVFYYDTLSHEREPYRVLMSPVVIEGQPYTFVAKINLVEREDLIKSIALLFLGLITAMLVGLYFITKIMAAKLWEPFYESLHVLEQFEVDKSTETNLSQTSTNEFQRLNNSIENLIQKNTIIFNNQREFVENAAHELQTPLAVIQGKLETVFQQSHLSQEQSEALEKLNNAVTRLIRLNKNLLLLSKIDRDQFPQSETISINDIVKKNLDFFKEQADSKKIQITLQEIEQAQVQANPTLTEVLASNFFLNAIKHNQENGTITIRIAKRSLSFANTGISEPLPSEKIFSRFSKIDPSSQGTGLGLAIVKKIADLNRWSVGYRFESNLHIFSIDF